MGYWTTVSVDSCTFTLLDRNYSFFTTNSTIWLLFSFYEQIIEYTLISDETRGD